MAGQNPDNLASAILGVPAHVGELIVRYHDGDLSDAELSELRDALKQSAQARALFVQWSLNFQTLSESLSPQYREDDDDRSADVPGLGIVPNTEQDYTGILAELVRMEASAAPDIVVLDKPKRLEHADPNQDEDQGALSAGDMVAVGGYLLRRIATPKRLAYAGLAAVFVLAAALFALYQGGTDPALAPAPTFVQPPASVVRPTQTVATLTAQHDAQWAEGALAGGSALQAGQTLTLTAGSAEITTNRGAVAILEAPVTIELLGRDNAIRLHGGKLAGICETASSKGFLVRTPHMDITDLGTRFGVDVNRGRTEVHVHQGEVVVETKATADTKSTRQQLAANQAVRSDALNKTIASITPAFEKFDPSLRIYRLPGTGLGLAEGERDPSWQIVADANGPLDTPIQLTVQYSGEKGNHWPAKGNDPGKAQWLLYPNGYDVYNQPAVPGLDHRLLTVRTDIDLPDSADLDDAVLYLKYASNNGIKELRINGQPIDQLITDPNIHHLAGKFHEIELPIDTTALTHGENIIEMDMSLIRLTAPPTIYFYSEIRPSPGEGDRPPSP